LVSASPALPQPAVDIPEPTPILTLATSNVVYNSAVFQIMDTDSPKSIDTIKVVTSETGDNGERHRLELRQISNASSTTLVTEDAIISPVCQDISKKMTFATTRPLKREKSTETLKNVSWEVVVQKKTSRTVVLLVEDNIINLKVSLLSRVFEFHPDASLDTFNP
jgi:hypothetical protein